jgi:hypothetical protein
MASAPNVHEGIFGIAITVKNKTKKEVAPVFSLERDEIYVI